MAPITEQQRYMQQALQLIESVGGRVEIQKVNSDADNLISARNFDVKYKGDRPTIGFKKYQIDNLMNPDVRKVEVAKFEKRKTYSQIEYSKATLQKRRTKFIERAIQIAAEKAALAENNKH